MGLSCGLIGLPNAGKSTIFNALTSAGAQAAEYPFTTIEPNRGPAAAPDPRLDVLARLTGQSRVTPAAVEFVDIAGLVEGASRGQGLGNQFLGQIRNASAAVHVLRCFHNPGVVHQAGRPDPAADFETVRTELALADLEVLQRRMDKDAKPAQSGEAGARLRLEACRRFTEQIDQGERPSPGDQSQAAVLSELGLLTAKPFLLAANADEEELGGGPLVRSAEELAEREGVRLVVICGDLEAEMMELAPDERAEFLASLGQEKPALELLIQAAFQTLGLITFFTVVGAELRAWPAAAGTTAVDCAAEIHTDLARGFIAAEVCSFEELAAAGSVAAARDSGRLRLEGRDYIVSDGDVITFRFNV